MELRSYQSAAVEAVYRYLRAKPGNPCVVIPTGGGKTPILATLCRDAVTRWDGRALVLAHVKELVEQAADKLRAVCPAVPVGVYSAGLGRRDTAGPVIVAGIQSVYDKAESLGRFDLVIVDEAHLIPPAGDGMYRTLFAGLVERNPDLRVIGLTATPYRLGSGPICSPEGVLTEVCFQVGVRELIAQGHLCPLVGKAAAAEVDTSGLRIVRGEYADAEAEAAFAARDVVAAAAEEIVSRTADRRAVLAFCQTVEHGRRVAAALRSRLGEPAADAGGPATLFDPERPASAVAEVYGDTPAADRDRAVAAFKAGRVKYLVNVAVLTTGFDAPNVDCVCLLRATASPGLYYQMVGRGFRLADGKANCLVLDFGGNIERHGPVDAVRPRTGPAAKGGDGPAGKVCPGCRTVAPASASVCLDCGHEWPKADDRREPHGATPADAAPVSEGPKTESREVQGVTYRVHTKRGADDSAPKTLRVTYQLNLNEYVSEWVCVEHPAGSFARRKAEGWWSRRCDYPCPTVAVEAAQVAEHGLLAGPSAVTVRTKPGEPFPEIIDADLPEPPRCPRPCETCGAVNLRVIVPSGEPRHPGRIVCGECNRLHGHADAATVERYGFWEPGRGGLLPAGWEFDPADATTPVAAVDDEIPF